MFTGYQQTGFMAGHAYGTYVCNWIVCPKSTNCGNEIALLTNYT